jgi:hypothetical protein
MENMGDYDNDGYLDLFVANPSQNNFCITTMAMALLPKSLQGQSPSTSAFRALQLGGH